MICRIIRDKSACQAAGSIRARLITTRRCAKPEEEIGVAPRDVKVVGAMSSLWVIVSGFVVYPFVGVCGSRPDFRADRARSPN